MGGAGEARAPNPLRGPVLDNGSTPMATRSKHALLFLLAAVLLVALVAPTRAQRLFPGEIEIRQALERLNTLGSAMMIGAHPDDDREVVLAYLSRGRHVRTAY